MKATVCELPDDRTKFAAAWESLCEHTRNKNSDLVLLPEMIFSGWLAASKEENDAAWNRSVQEHLDWIERLPELGAQVVAGSRPAAVDGIRQNLAFVWSQGSGLRDVHAKRYLPNEPGFWEAEWYQRGPDKFSPVQTEVGKAGFLICTELWFSRHARDYGQDGVQLLLCPRATESRSVEKWTVGGRAASVVSGAYCLSSNRSWMDKDGMEVTAAGWIIEPQNGEVLGRTTAKQPFLTLEIDLSEADRAKSTYPRDVIG